MIHYNILYYYIQQHILYHILHQHLGRIGSLDPNPPDLQREIRKGGSESRSPLIDLNK